MGRFDEFSRFMHNLPQHTVFSFVFHLKKAPATHTTDAVFNEYGACFHAVPAILSVLSFMGAQVFARA